MLSYDGTFKGEHDGDSGNVDSSSLQLRRFVICRSAFNNFVGGKMTVTFIALAFWKFWTLEFLLYHLFAQDILAVGAIMHQGDQNCSMSGS